MEKLNEKLDGLNLKGIKESFKIVDKTEVGLFSVEQRRLTDAYFETSKGYMHVETIISLICVDSADGKRIEMPACIKMKESIDMAKYLIEKGFSFKELPKEVRRMRNYRAILRNVEFMLRFEVKNKGLEEIAATSNLNPAKKIQKEMPNMKTISEIPSYREGELSQDKKSMLKDIIKLRNLANALINELSKK